METCDSVFLSHSGKVSAKPPSSLQSLPSLCMCNAETLTETKYASQFNTTLQIKQAS